MSVWSLKLPAAYLETLNSEQRRVVEHGVREKDCTPGPPLLVIAGAVSCKTNTLAYRIADRLSATTDSPAMPKAIVRKGE